MSDPKVRYSEEVNHNDWFISKFFIFSVKKKHSTLLQYEDTHKLFEPVYFQV